MSSVLTVRIEPSLLTRAEARAARLGLNRARYVRNLIQRDLEGEQSPNNRKFASDDLVGAYRLGKTSASNKTVRQRLQSRALRQREIDR
jgi:hypothetical protein